MNRDDPELLQPTRHRPNSTYERDFAGAVIDRVITTPTSLAH
jgi:hypothetical protein